MVLIVAVSVLISVVISAVISVKITAWMSGKIGEEMLKLYGESLDHANEIKNIVISALEEFTKKLCKADINKSDSERS